ncbi:hypothetical protein H6F32_08920 [Anabaena sp. FACHB-1237]|uniref:hypothetical protein n=1 Tax=Anabaena sp. FACHB-1237 TaxID=2692769 RepID=UPI001680EA75|nr:hypothetical protein [Anabaena sp. FACHB-1237]MBD2137705.1 hypothetical protein [Anabaena sp. FACHB-1237]
MTINTTANHSNVIKSTNFVHSPEPLQTVQTNVPGSLLLDNKVHHEYHQVMNLNNTPLIPPATDNQDRVVVMENSEDNYQKDWIAEPDINQQNFVNTEFQQLLNLNEELRQANNDLYSELERLKTELAETEKILQWQKTRSAVTESMFNQQNQELSAANEQIQSLYQQLDVSNKTVQRQEIMIDTYKSQLQISQHRLAQLERECSLLQTNYSEESQQLLHSENTCRELRTRLMRQQRQTLQFKAALEKCLDKPVFHGDTIEDACPPTHNPHYRETRFSRKAHSILNNPQPIQPWSVDLEDTIAIAESSENIIPENQPSTNLPDNLIEEVMKELSQVQELSNITPITSPTNNTSKIDHEEMEDYWLDSPSGTQTTLSDDAFISILPESIKKEQEEKKETLSPQQSPSPLIYPQRPPKGRKSLASVELPNFRTKGGTADS